MRERVPRGVKKRLPRPGENPCQGGSREIFEMAHRFLAA
jgi:hypothetical protein